jgi:TonB family protein
MDIRALGSYILVEEFAETAFGRIYKALPLKGEPKISLLHVLKEEIRKEPQTATIIKTYFEKWKKIKDINILNLLDWQEKNEELCYVFEYERGRLLSDLLAECRKEGIPLAYDQAVYLTSRIVEGILSVKSEDFFYGNFTTEQIFVTFEGEVRLLPGVFRDLHRTPIRHSSIFERFVRSYPDDLKEGRAVRSRDHVYFMGLIFFEFLCRETFETPEQPFDPKERLEEARKGMGMGDGVPENLMNILEKCLLQERDDSFKTLDELKSDLDDLVNSGEYSPSTFNTAFLIHTLYRDQDEEEAKKDGKLLLLDRKAHEPKPERKIPRPQIAAESEAPPSTFGIEAEQEPESKKRMIAGIGATAGVVILVVLGWLIFGPGGGKGKEELKAKQEESQKLKELEEQNRLLKEQLGKLQTEAKQKEEQVAQAKTPEEKAQAQKALDEAKKKLAETQKIVEDVKKPPAAPAAKEPSTPAGQPQTPPSQAQPGAAESTAEPEKKTETPAEPQPAAADTADVKQGDFADYVSLDVRPQQVNEIKPDYPSLARQNKVEGRVYVKVDIDENGAVTGAQVVKGPSPDYGLFDACVAAAKKTKFSPGMKNNVRVKTSYTLNYSFTLKK